MGLSITRIQFESGIPAFLEIRNAFRQQTGLRLELSMRLQLEKLTSNLPEIRALLTQGSNTISELERHWRDYAITNYRYLDLALAHREYTQDQKNRLNFVDRVQFNIPDFYQLDFELNENEIKIESYYNQHYGIISLLKTLIDLGGRFVERKNEDEPYPKKWRKLKRWEDYNWVTQPAK